MLIDDAHLYTTIKKNLSFNERHNYLQWKILKNNSNNLGRKSKHS